MKVSIQFKNPDAVANAIREAVEREVEVINGLKGSERELIIDERCTEVDALLEKWIEWSEYVTVEFDTEAKTACVKEVAQ